MEYGGDRAKVTEQMVTLDQPREKLPRYYVISQYQREKIEARKKESTIVLVGKWKMTKLDAVNR